MYGSETGNGKQISKDLRESLNQNQTLSRQIVRCKLNKYKRVKFAEKDSIKIVIFFCSSTGDGESPENAQEFFRFLRRESSSYAEGDERASKLLSHVFYTMLGLGDSNYSRYQGAPRFLDARLKMLGATCFSPRVEADEATSLETVIEPWLETIGDLIATQSKNVE